jgi:comEA protein
MQSTPSARRGRTQRARALLSAHVRAVLSAHLRAVLLAAGLAATLAAGALPAAAVADGVVNVNTATAEELARLPGIGEAKARAILEFRKERGAFKSVDQLREVKGIGDAALERIRPHVALEGKTTLP